MSIVVVVAPVDPTFALRTGAIIAAAALVVSLKALSTTWVDLWAVLYALWIAASNYWSIDSAATELSSINTAACVVLFIAVRTVAFTRNKWLTTAGALVVGCVYVVYRIFADNQLQAITWTLDSTGTRYALANVNANYLAYSLVTTIAILLLIMGSATRRNRVLLLGLCVVFYIGVIQAGTRGALLGITLGVAWGGLNWAVRFKTSRALGYLLFALLIVATSIAAGALQRALLGRISSSSRESGDLNGRLTVWPMARDRWSENLWLGQGAGTFPSTNAIHIAAHNFVLDIGSGVGMVGVALFILVLYRALWTETLRMAARVSLVGAYALTSAPLLLTGFWIESPCFWLGLGLLTRAHTLSSRQMTKTLEGGADSFPDTSDPVRPLSGSPGWQRRP